MQIVELEPHVLANRTGVAFHLKQQNVVAECVITIETLQTYFWLAPGATDAQVLKAFQNGYSRIRAIAERKLLARNIPRLELTASDFAPPGR